MKTNTFFAASTWYDDDDSEPYYIRPYKERTGIRIPNRSSLWSDDYCSYSGGSYLIKDTEKIQEIMQHNERRNKLFKKWCIDNNLSI